MAAEWPGRNWCPDRADVFALLEQSEIETCELLPSGSNYVFVLRLNAGEAGSGFAVYKPKRGESPLWDYPSGTLYKREHATYLLNEALGWGIVPPTTVRDGPYGIGMVQLFIEHDQRATFFSLRDSRADELRRMATFDAIVNNGDRKGGHCLLGLDDRIWGIDHGLTFHAENKLRTVIWDYAGEPVPELLLQDVRRLQSCLDAGSDLSVRLRGLISRQEFGALLDRIEMLLRERSLPRSGYRRSVPWPPV
jgi:hypothetical protein